MSIKTGQKSWMALKVDLEKAYDRLEWDFIVETLRALGLPDKFIGLVMSCVRSVETQVIWNGTISEAFKPSQGIRQGDPLSPYLFVLCMKRLSQAIYDRIEKNGWRSIKFSRSRPGLSHIFFVDDLLIFVEANEPQLQVIRETLETFCRLSGHRISAAKTQIYFSQNCPESSRISLANLLGFELVVDLGKYLGVPLLHKRVTKATFTYLLDKMRARLSGWATRTLSLAGCITLAKAVLQGIPSYLMQSNWIPVGV
ncbi:hypothetical protein HRI_002692000 [Hibiscus trionum]|uniref:Reverse transcriptase domain-containing protein n=1 Tax=Hibiscus trionum TaxID=183268 RepID=A0A9W7M547_HIBTR|nr:hypothetical protein HRI_002692000 [Hibiscus trionum]